MHAGGKAEPVKVTDEMLDSSTVRPKLIDDGMFLVGLDIVGDKLMEVNVFSPGGLGSCQKLYGVRLHRTRHRERSNARSRSASTTDQLRQRPARHPLNTSRVFHVVTSSGRDSQRDLMDRDRRGSDRCLITTRRTRRRDRPRRRARPCRPRRVRISRQPNSVVRRSASITPARSARRRRASARVLVTEATALPCRSTTRRARPLPGATASSTALQPVRTPAGGPPDLDEVAGALALPSGRWRGAARDRRGRGGGRRRRRSGRRARSARRAAR